MTGRPSRRPWPTRIVKVLGLVALLIGCRGGTQDEVVGAQERTPTSQLARRSVGEPLDQSNGSHRGFLHAGETVVHPLPVKVGEAIVVEVDQTDLDVEIQVLAPNEEVWFSWDTPTNRGAPERLCFVAASTGTYKLSLRPFRGAGGYEVRLVRRRQATEADQLCFRAARSFQVAGTRELPEKITELEAAASDWERADEPFLAGLAWREAASAWLNLGPPENAVDRFEKALGRAREAKSTYLEVSVLNRLGLALIDLGEFDRARASLEQAETRARETGKILGPGKRADQPRAT